MVAENSELTARIMAKIAEVKALRDRVLDFEEDNADVLIEYINMMNKMSAAESELKTLMATTPMESGTKFAFAPGWVVSKTKGTASMNVPILFRKAPEFVVAHPEMFSITMKNAEAAVACGQLPRDVFDAALTCGEGAVKTSIPAYKEGAR